MRARFSLLFFVSALFLPAAGEANAYQDVLLQQATPRFTVLSNHRNKHLIPGRRGGGGAQLVQWNGKFRDTSRSTITFTMVGTDPSRNNAATTIPIVIVPIKMVYGSNNGHMSFDPASHIVQGTTKTVLQLILGSPVFKSSIVYQQGGVNLGQGLPGGGATQYSDAFQRGNFWSSVKTNTAYQVLLGSPTVLSTQAIQVTPTQGKVIRNPFGASSVGTMDIRLFDLYLQSYMSTFSATITANVLPLFITYNVFLTDGACCIAGYHSANGAQPSGQTYAYSTFVDDPGSFAQDVSAISHEVGEWMDNPFADNLVNCSNDNTNGYLEVGDPLEGDTNSGAYAYRVNGYSYNLQSLAFMPYWGAPTNTSVNEWYTFQGSPTQNPASHDSRTGVCPGPQHA